MRTSKEYVLRVSTKGFVSQFSFVNPPNLVSTPEHILSYSSCRPILLQFLWLDRPRAKSNLRHRPRLLTRIITLLDLSYPSTKPDFPLKKYSIPVRALRISLPLYNTIFLLVLLSQANPTSGMGWLMRLSLTSKSKSSHEIGEGHSSLYTASWLIPVCFACRTVRL